MSETQREVKQALLDHAGDLAEVLAKKARKGNLYAVVKALEWAIGKPKQEVEHTGKDGGPIQAAVQLLTDDELREQRALAARIAERSNAGGGSGKT